MTDNMQRLRGRLPEGSFAVQLVEAVVGKSETEWQAKIEELVSKRLTQKIQGVQITGKAAAVDES